MNFFFVYEEHRVHNFKLPPFLYSKGPIIWAGWGPFLKDLDNYSGPELCFKIRIYRIVVQFLAYKQARLVSST